MTCGLRAGCDHWREQLFLMGSSCRSVMPFGMYSFAYPGYVVCKNDSGGNPLNGTEEESHRGAQKYGTTHMTSYLAEASPPNGVVD